jgi:4-hydroxy-tetrahydrodipicolinate reductase
MGSWIVRLIQTEFAKKAEVTVAIDRDESMDPLLDTDVVIDFSTPFAMTTLAKIALARGTALPTFVVGSTGWKIDERKVIEDLATRTHALMSSNFSIGVMAVTEILKYASPILEKLRYNPIILETHHQYKKDSPSGTALSLQRAIAPAGPGNVQTHSIRAGEIIGDHEITFYGTGDHIKIGHYAQDRSIFARGAIEAALWITGKARRGSTPRGLIHIETFFKEMLEG